jgi:hypothetical protein
MVKYISLASDYENREKEKKGGKKAKNWRYKENCKYYEQFSSSIVIIEHRRVKE